MLKRESRAFYGEKSPVRAAAASAGKEDKNMAAITVAFVFGTLAYDMYKVICRK